MAWPRPRTSASGRQCLHLPPTAANRSAPAIRSGTFRTGPSRDRRGIRYRGIWFISRRPGWFIVRLLRSVAYLSVGDDSRAQTPAGGPVRRECRRVGRSPSRTHRTCGPPYGRRRRHRKLRTRRAQGSRPRRVDAGPYGRRPVGHRRDDRRRGHLDAGVRRVSGGPRAGVAVRTVPGTDVFDALGGSAAPR